MSLCLLFCGKISYSLPWRGRLSWRPAWLGKKRSLALTRLIKISVGSSEHCSLKHSSWSLNLSSCPCTQNFIFLLSMFMVMDQTVPMHWNKQCTYAICEKTGRETLESGIWFLPIMLDGRDRFNYGAVLGSKIRLLRPQ